MLLQRKKMIGVLDLFLITKKWKHRCCSRNTKNVAQEMFTSQASLCAQLTSISPSLIDLQFG
jgi:hypothetical protein